MQPAVLIREAGWRTLRAVIPLAEETTIGGLADGVDVGIASPVAVVWWRDGAWWIRAHASDVWVDGALLSGAQPLRHGQMIEGSDRRSWQLHFLLGDRDSARDELRHVETVCDGMTMLLNRRTAYAMLERMTSGVVMMIDIDWLKQLNDRHGMMAGDTAIRRTAAIVRARVAWPNIAARYGGEEFLVLMPGASFDDARALAEAIRAAAEPTIPYEGESLTPTVSIGLGRHTGQGTPALRAADEALMQAKVQGRNRVFG